LKTVLTVALSWLCLVTLEAEDERILMDTKINGVPVQFAFDTGAGVSFELYSRTAEKLGLKVTLPTADGQIGPGQTRVGWTEPQKMDLGLTNIETAFAVVEIPAYLKATEGGMFGWLAVSNDVFSLDCVTHSVSPLTNARRNFRGWVKCHIQTNSDLTLELPGKNRPKKIIALDSGTIYGVKLNPEEWRKWKAIHANQPMTMEAYFTPGAGLVVSEEAWADKISLGKLALSDVPVMQADSSDIALHSSSQSQFEATLGLGALKRLDIIIDGKRGLAFLRPKGTPSMPYEYNHFGAVFVPQDPQSDDLIAHVIKGSPAYKAGIRNGDVLLEIDGKDVTHWRDGNIKINTTFSERPAGSKLEFTLERGDKIFKTVAILQNILPPDSAANSN
jgi:hypothetical protein